MHHTIMHSCEKNQKLKTVGVRWGYRCLACVLQIVVANVYYIFV